MPDPRVIFVNRVYWPSATATAQLLTDLAGGLAARGWNVHVVTTGETSAVHNGVSIHRTGTPEQHGGLVSRVLNHRGFLRGARRQLLGLLEPGDIVVALTDPPLLGAMVAAAARARGARVVHWIQDIYPEIAAVHFGALARIFLSPLKAKRDRAWQEAALCITLGADMAKVVAARGVAASRIQILPNWAPSELHTPAPASAVAARRQHWGYSDKFVVAYSGNLGRVHEFTTLIDAATLLRDASSIVFLFIGQGARFEEVAAVVRARSLMNVRLLPPEPRTGLAVSLAAADAHCVTLRPEYASLVFPSKLAGVLAAGRPVIFVGPPTGDIAHLLREKNCGASFEPGAAVLLATALRRWQAEPGLGTQMGINARNAYAAAYTCEIALGRWQDILRITGASA